jgi:hypothetical protein
MRLGSRLTLRRALKVVLEHGVGALADPVDAANDLVVGLLRLGQFASGGLLVRVAEAVVGVLAAEVDDGRHAQLGGDPIEGADQAVVAAKVVSCSPPGRTGRPRSASRPEWR